MTHFYRCIAVLFTLDLYLLRPAHAQFDSLFGGNKGVADQRQEILNKNEVILMQLYQAQPKAKELIEKSVGYATFSNFGMKILMAGGGTRSGVVIDKANIRNPFL